MQIFCHKEKVKIFKLGTGNGVSVLEAIQAFESSTGQKLDFNIGPRRTGDIVAIYANNEKAVNELGWDIKYDLHSMMKTAWDWEVKIKEDETLHELQNPLLN